MGDTPWAAATPASAVERAMTDGLQVLVLVDDDAARERAVAALDDRYDVVVADASEGTLPEFDLCIADHDALTHHYETILERKHDSGGVFLPCLFLRGESHGGLPDWELATVDAVVSLSDVAETLADRVDALLDHRARTVELAEQKRRELRQQEAFTEAAIEALPDLFYVFDTDGSLQRWNGRAREITGYDDDELARMHTLDFLPEADRDGIARRIEAAFRAGESYTIEVPLVTRDGTTIPYEFKVAPLWDPDGELSGGVGIGRDITDRRMRQELSRQNERLEQFASIVSHDLRNPIAVANGFLDLAAQDCDSPHLDRVDGALDRMETLIDDLLALARQGMTVDDVEPVSLASAATGAWSSVASDTASLDVVTDRALLADASRLQQLLENLFRNSVEHGSTGSRDGGSRPDDSVEHGSTGNRSAQRSGDSVEHGGADVTVTVGDLEEGFYVADDGPGIPADQRDGVFEYGYTTSDDGTGFGLAIVRQIAEAHGWSVAVTESDSGGARFEFTGVDRPLD
ncbi:hybrid sensor histidine kinase/response regulator [Halorarius litoreus]|uniref:hybrid sensor histidine kinase/response regulator n=1 Tax=Halorarius litoreus TaxID=2962676 RepID=UPI0020CCF537|nr:PAS domain S-box protein [Halorarius litoreus]